MAQDFNTPTPPPLEQPRRRSNVWTIVLIVILVLFCCCFLIAGLGWYLWTYGDQIFGLTQYLVYLLV